MLSFGYFSGGKVIEYKNLVLDEERALYGLKDSSVENCRFDGPADGESALKESERIKVSNSYFNLRYPFWHVTDAEISSCELTGNCRAPLWYDRNVVVVGCTIKGIKALRECESIVLKKCRVNSEEFIWKCRNMTVEDVVIEESEYPFFEVKDSKIRNLKMKGKYSFQYCSGIKILNSEFDTKDAFWHTKNLSIHDSVIKGEYLGWYSENLSFVNCRIIGTQPFCYCKNLVLENCTMEDCDLAFERSSVMAKISGKIDSVKNPLSGRIEADSIGQVIMEESIVDPSKTEIVCHA